MFSLCLHKDAPTTMSLFVESLNFALRNDVVPFEVAHLSLPHVLGLYYFPTWMTWTYAPMIIRALEYCLQYYFGYCVTRFITMPWLNRIAEANPMLPLFFAVIINIVLYSTMSEALVPFVFAYYFK